MAGAEQFHGARNTELADFCAELQRARTVGIVTCAVQARRQPHSLPSADLRAFIAGLGLSSSGWDRHPLARPDALTLLHFVVQRDLAYRNVHMSSARAHDFALRFLDLFSATAHFSTNCWFRVTPPPSGQPWVEIGTWTPITGATFDAGVVCCDALRMGILWVADED